MLAPDPRMSAHTDGTSQTMRALLRLRELLLSGEFAPGARMSELPLVDRLGVGVDDGAHLDSPSSLSELPAGAGLGGAHRPAGSGSTERRGSAPA